MYLEENPLRGGLGAVVDISCLFEIAKNVGFGGAARFDHLKLSKDWAFRKLVVWIKNGN